MNTSITIAQYFLSLANSEAKGINPMKLIKLVYIAHGWNLALFDNPLIDENPEAWRYGPVIPSLYREYKSFKDKNIDVSISSELNISQETKDLLKKIWDVYGKFSAIELSSMTHRAGTPWYTTWNSIKDAEYLSLQIPDKLTQEHYKAKLEKNKSKA